MILLIGDFQSLHKVVPHGGSQTLLELKNARQTKHVMPLFQLGLDIRRSKRLMGQQEIGEQYEAEVILDRPVP